MARRRGVRSDVRSGPITLSLAPRWWLGALALVLLATLAGCAREVGTPPAVGTLERDRIELTAEARELILEIPVREGDPVAAGDLVLVQDARFVAAQLSGALAARDVAAARLAELVRGTRREEIDEARARLSEARSAVAEAVPEAERIRVLVRRGVEPQRSLEQAQAALGETRARREAASSFLARLLHGTTVEQLDQARAQLAQAEAAVEEIRIRKDRLQVVAPRAGVLDALPFEVGERPPAGATVAVVLADGAPFARVYVSAQLRPRVHPGLSASITVEGLDTVFAARVRWVSSEAAFTPFFALTERDRGRLSYLAEIDLIEPAARSLPTGLAVEATFGARSEEGAAEDG